MFPTFLFWVIFILKLELQRNSNNNPPHSPKSGFTDGEVCEKIVAMAQKQRFSEQSFVCDGFVFRTCFFGVLVS